MAVYYRSQGLVIRKVDFGEADQIFKIYTKDFGKLDIFGKAVRKVESKLRSGADFLYLSNLEFVQGRNKKTLTDAVVLENFSEIRKSLRKMEISRAMSEVLDRLAGLEDKNEKLWKLIKESFSKLGEIEESKSILLYYYFLWNLFSILGYLPELKTCVSCFKKPFLNAIYFSPAEGGMICHSCSVNSPDSFSVKPDLIKVLRIITQKDWPVVARLKIDANLKTSLVNVSQKYLDEIIRKN
jgi:DNA repair protein RecO (recombination protein O)